MNFIKKIYNFWDPRKIIWIEVIRIVNFAVALLIVLAGIIIFFASFFIMFFSGASTFDIISGIGVLIGSVIISTIFLFFSMLSLNMLYNINQIRINTETKLDEPNVEG